MLGRAGEAEAAFTRAAGLADDPALRRYLFQRAAVRV
jgi:predicted RNA polymerase sigma factor